MQYQYKELKEANGADYPLTNKPKEMLVWDSSSDGPVERAVLGYHQGRWVANDICGVGVCSWLHAAEIPAAKETLLTNRELAKWLAQGNGEWRATDWDRMCAVSAARMYEERYANEPAANVLIRKWDDTVWHKPTREYAFDEVKNEA